MKKQLAFYAIISLLLNTLACQPDVNIPGNDRTDKYTMIYMPQAEGGARSYKLTIKSKPDEFVLGATYGGLKYISKDIKVGIQVDTSLVAAYNTEKRTSYTVLSSNAYTLSDSIVTILSGNSASSSIKLLVNTQVIAPFVEYMLPVKIVSISSEVTVNEKLRIAYFIIKIEPNLKDYQRIDRTNWSVVDFSSEEPAENNWGNGGQVLHTFDGKDNTFWHSKWNGGEAPPPHWFIIDMGSTQTLHGLSFLTRQSDNSGKPNEVEVETSSDNIKWSPAGSFNLQNVKEWQNQFLTSGFNKEARYLKATVKSSYNAGYTHLAEIHAF